MTRTPKLATRCQPARKRLKNLPGLEHLELREVLDATLRFDFGTADSPLSPTFTRVTEASRYDSAVGYGWLSGQVQSRDRGGADPATRDFNFSRDATFAVNLANGTYNLSLTMGDRWVLHDQDVYLQGQKVDSVTARADEYLTRTYTVSVTDGRLALRLYGIGGLDEYAVVNTLVITPAAPAGVNLNFDFGTADSPLSPTFTRVTEASRYDPAVGYGWLSGQVQSRDRGGADPATRDFNFSRDATFAVDVANGTYTVTVTMGDAFSGHDQMGVFLEGAQVDSVTAAQAQFVRRTYTVTVGDGQLTLRLRDLGGADVNAVINALTITGGDTTPPPPPTPAPITAQFQNSGPVNEGGSATVSFTNVAGGSGGYRYSFDFDNDGTFEVSNSSSATAAVPSSFLADGPLARVVRGLVRDSAGAEVSYTTSVQVNNVAPTAVITSASPGTAAGSFAFVGTANDPSAADQASLRYSWDFGDGATASGATASHTYTASGTYTVRLTVSDKDGGAGVASTTVTVSLATPPPPPAGSVLRFDFGPATDSPVAAGFTLVTPTTLYASGAGYGWSAGRIDSRDRGAVVGPNEGHVRLPGDDLTRDFCFSSDATFKVQVPNGTYPVKIWTGDFGSGQNASIYLQGQLVDTFSAKGGYVLIKYYLATVTTGELTLRLVGLNGGNAVLNGLEINGEYVPPYVPTTTHRFDFGTKTSPVATGYTQVSNESFYNNQIGFGWVAYNGLPFAVDRGTGTDLTRDFIYNNAPTFRIDLPNGTYRVEATFADPASTHDMNVYLQGVLQEWVVAPAGQTVVRTYTVTVTEGYLLFRMDGREPGGVDEMAIINALRIDPIA